MSGFGVPVTVMGDMAPLDFGERPAGRPRERAERDRAYRGPRYARNRYHPDTGCRMGGPSCLACRRPVCVLDEPGPVARAAAR